MTCNVPGETSGPAVAAVTCLAHPGPAGPGVTFADLTTTRVGGPIADYWEVRTEAAFVDAVREADDAGRPLLVLGGGSNMLASDEPFDGVVVRDMRSGVQADTESACNGALVQLPAGQPWDEFVAEAVQEGWMGVEALSGIPGTVGATPIQNVGAYGQEVSETLASARVWDRLEGRTRLFPLKDLEFAYRDSALKRTLRDAEAGGGRVWGPTGRHVVLQVDFQMRFATRSAPIRYAELARLLGVEVGDRADSRAVREAVLDLRRGKGMVLDPADHDTWSTGSFFTNPIVSEEAAEMLPPEAPRYPVVDHTVVAQIDGNPAVVPGLVKTSAAWLIDHAGFGKGYGQPGPASLSDKHVLALTNRGGATAADIRALADEVVAGVKGAWGITLVPEPVIL